MLPAELRQKLRKAAETPVIDGDLMPRLIAIEQATAWGKRNYPQYFKEDDDDATPPPPQRRTKSPQSKAD
jgi:hypothetical protein